MVPVSSSIPVQQVQQQQVQHVPQAPPQQVQQVQQLPGGQQFHSIPPGVGPVPISMQPPSQVHPPQFISGSVPVSGFFHAPPGQVVMSSGMAPAPPPQSSPSHLVTSGVGLHSPQRFHAPVPSPSHQGPSHGQVYTTQHYGQAAPMQGGFLPQAAVPHGQPISSQGQPLLSPAQPLSSPMQPLSSPGQPISSSHMGGFPAHSGHYPSHGVTLRGGAAMTHTQPQSSAPSGHHPPQYMTAGTAAEPRHGSFQTGFTSAQVHPTQFAQPQPPASPQRVPSAPAFSRAFSAPVSGAGMSVAGMSGGMGGGGEGRPMFFRQLSSGAVTPIMHQHAPTSTPMVGNFLPNQPAQSSTVAMSQGYSPGTSGAQMAQAQGFVHPHNGATFQNRQPHPGAAFARRAPPPPLNVTQAQGPSPASVSPFTGTASPRTSPYHPGASPMHRGSVGTPGQSPGVQPARGPFAPSPLPYSGAGYNTVAPHSGQLSPARFISGHPAHAHGTPSSPYHPGMMSQPQSNPLPHSGTPQPQRMTNTRYAPPSSAWQEHTGVGPVKMESSSSKPQRYVESKMQESRAEDRSVSPATQPFTSSKEEKETFGRLDLADQEESSYQGEFDTGDLPALNRLEDEDGIGWTPWADDADSSQGFGLGIGQPGHNGRVKATRASTRARKAREVLMNEFFPSGSSESSLNEMQPLTDGDRDDEYMSESRGYETDHGPPNASHSSTSSRRDSALREDGDVSEEQYGQSAFHQHHPSSRRGTKSEENETFFEQHQANSEEIGQAQDAATDCYLKEEAEPDRLVGGSSQDTHAPTGESPMRHQASAVPTTVVVSSSINTTDKGCPKSTSFPSLEDSVAAHHEAQNSEAAGDDVERDEADCNGQETEPPGVSESVASADYRGGDNDSQSELALSDHHPSPEPWQPPPATSEAEPEFVSQLVDHEQRYARSVNDCTHFRSVLDYYCSPAEPAVQWRSRLKSRLPN